MTDLVLTYHRVSGGRDPLLQCVAPERFDAQMRRLRTLADVVPLAALDEPSRDRRVAVTFDDGYADNAAVAVPALRAASVPATFFIVTGSLDDRTEFWWDRLEHHHLDSHDSVAFVDAQPDGRPVRIDVRTGEGRLRALKALNRRLRPLPATAIAPTVAAVAAQFGVDDDPSCDEHARMTPDDVVAIAADPLFEIGSHGETHTMLAALSPQACADELARSRARLEALRIDVASFAYPYGTPESFTDENVRAVRDAGYTRAFVNMPGRAGRRDAFRRPRWMVYDWAADEFEAHIRSWFDDL